MSALLVFALASDRVDARRAAIGWAKTLAETQGDLEIGKPCAM